LGTNVWFEELPNTVRPAGPLAPPPSVTVTLIGALTAVEMLGRLAIVGGVTWAAPAQYAVPEFVTVATVPSDVQSYPPQRIISVPVHVVVNDCFRFGACTEELIGCHELLAGVYRAPLPSLFRSMVQSSTCEPLHATARDGESVGAPDTVIGSHESDTGLYRPLT
jgi:hypothetical protein